MHYGQEIMVTTKMFVLFLAVLFAGMLLFIHAGRRIAAWQHTHRSDAIRGSTAAVDGAVLGLIGLLLAFTFAGAGARFDSRRSLVAQEANHIGTAYLRLDLLPPQTQPKLREDFRRYVRSRLAVYEKVPDAEAVGVELRKSEEIQNEIWKQVVTASQQSGSPAVMMLVLSSVNQMIDITTTRTVASETHPPLVIFLMLGVTVMASCLLASYSMSLAGRPSLLHMIVYVLLVGVAVYVTFDFEYPRTGLLRVDPIDHVLTETMERMK
jgi:hypothetical protein